MRMRFNRKLTIIVLLLFITIGFISLAYAVLRKDLNITYNKITQQALIWDVGFNAGTVTPTTLGTSSTGKSCGDATVNATTATIGATSLSKPGDKCIWHLVVNNSGTIDASISSFDATAATGTDVTCTMVTDKNKMTCGNIIYSLNSDSEGTLLPKNTLLPKRTSVSTPGTLDVYLIAEYNSDVTSLNLTSSIVQNSARFTINFTQK